ncbi:co-chaperone YbbN [Alteromonas alba]|jgi:putative thioredoxin|uniref:Co-chaperone YbbN n=1 Tax=Alteromonas alba TaxID=2079529 RepID=A0A2S9V5P4_9ALTE|nr:co-chaperone YbbN [Alteromonas alba]PRO71768.1 co-chaperone YbbN [Alteromonas alba]
MQQLMSNNIVDLTVENFQQIILEVSKEKIVLIDFWAEGYEPCKELSPILEKIAGDYPDALLLARVDCEREQQVAAQFGIRNLPTVMVVKDAQPVDGFAGMQPEIEIRAMLGKYLPSPEDEFLAKAAELIASGDYSGAFPMAKQAYEINPDNVDSKYLYIDCLIETGAVPAAKELLAEIKLVDQDQRYHTLQGKVELAEQAADTPEIRALQEQAAANPDDLQVKVDLAVALYQVQRFEEALELLYGVLLKDFGFGEAKKLILDIINALPDGDSLKSGYRRKVYSLMY